MATSELNRFLEDVDEKVLECTICRNRLQNPKSLNCLHSFCLTCLVGYVEGKGKLTCPTCSKSYTIPEGGLPNLPPNTFLNNLLETIEQFAKVDPMKCVCGKEGPAKCYCQDCRQYLCSTCSDHHNEFRLFADHKLHLVEDRRSMSFRQLASLHPPLCLVHSNTFDFYCDYCKIPICTTCTIKDHKVEEGKHKPISISEAFQTFKETLAGLENSTLRCKSKLQDGLKAVIQNDENLEESNATSLRDIDKHVEEMMKKIKENGGKMKKKVDSMYKKKKKKNEAQNKELRKTMLDVNTKLSFINQLMKSDEVRVMQSSEMVITALKERINKLPKTEPSDNGQFYFISNEQQIEQQCDIGNVEQLKEAVKRPADCPVGEETPPKSKQKKVK